VCILRPQWQIRLPGRPESKGQIADGQPTAYAFYFDYKRRTDSDFRRAIKRDARRQARMAKEAKEVEGKQHQEAIKQAVEEAQKEGFPTDIEEREAYFMQQVSMGESEQSMALHSPMHMFLTYIVPGTDPVGAALSFYRALCVYPEPKTLISIYENTVSKEVLEILAAMCAQDKELSAKIGGSASGSEGGHGVE
jgi:mitochondrial import receptor subunit TOM20